MSCPRDSPGGGLWPCILGPGQQPSPLEPRRIQPLKCFWSHSSFISSRPFQSTLSGFLLAQNSQKTLLASHVIHGGPNHQIESPPQVFPGVRSDDSLDSQVTCLVSLANSCAATPLAFSHILRFWKLAPQQMNLVGDTIPPTMPEIFLCFS